MRKSHTVEHGSRRNIGRNIRRTSGRMSLPQMLARGHTAATRGKSLRRENMDAEFLV